MEIEYRPGHYYPKGTFDKVKVEDEIVIDTPSEEDSKCICGLELDNSNPDCYSHMTQGY